MFPLISSYRVISPNPSPSSSPYLPKETPSNSTATESPRPTLRKPLSPAVENDIEFQELIELLQLSPEEAKKLTEKKNELESLDLFSLTSDTLGNLRYTAIKFDGQILFPIATNIQENEEVLNYRRKKIENTLNEIIKRNIPPNEIRVFPAIFNNQTVIIISRTNQSEDVELDERQRWILMTITAEDSRLYGINIPVLSKIACKIIDDALTDAWLARQPYSLLQQGLISLGILLGMITASWGLLTLEKYLVPRLYILIAISLLAYNWQPIAW